MKNKLILTSFIALSFAVSAMAEPANTATFPANGLMQEDYTYTNAATSTNMDGVYEGTVLAEAQYVNAEYLALMGHYLPAGADAVERCSGGNYCPGGTFAYNENNNQGLYSCPAGYNLSASGAGAETDCFRNCTVSDLPHATAVSGQVHYGTDVNTEGFECSATSCENGYHTDTVYGYGPLWLKIGHTLAQGIGYRNSSGEYIGDYPAIQLGIENGSNKWAIDYDFSGIVTGESICSTQGGTDLNGIGGNDGDFSNLSTASSLTADGGKNCWCKVTGYINSGTALQNLDSYWVLLRESNDSCAQCANNCANIMSGMYGYSVYREAVLMAVSFPSTRCTPNIINITWDGASQEAIDANEAGSCTYGGDIKTPQSATEIPGKIFKGWLFKATNNSSSRYTVTYDCSNGGHGVAPVSSTSYVNGQKVTLAQNTCTAPSGTSFAGWICSGVNVNNGTFTMPATNVTCTAQWEAM